MLLLEFLSETLGSLLSVSHLAVRRIISALVGSLTEFAYSQRTIATMPIACIQQVIRMSLRAICLVGVAVTTAKILTKRYGFEMGSINTKFIATQMVKYQLLRNASLYQFIRQAMHKNLSFLVSVVKDGQNAVSILANSTCPNKTLAKFWQPFGYRTNLGSLLKANRKGRRFNPLVPIRQMRGQVFVHASPL